MINKKYLKLIRSRERSRSTNFIYNIIAKRIIDSIDLLSVNFQNILGLGNNDDVINDYLQKKFIHANFSIVDIIDIKEIKKNNLKYKKVDLDNISIGNKKYDLIYSNLLIHLSDNFDNILKKILSHLNNNSFFIAAIPDVQNAYQLVNSLYKTDLFLYDGAYKRINPTIDINNILKNLKDLNFYIPTVNADSIKIEYKSFDKLINDIRETKSSYCHIDKRQNFENKKYLKVLENFYKEDHYNGKYELDIKFNIISAWKK